MVLVGFIVPTVLNIVSQSAAKKVEGTIYDFRMVPSTGISITGIVGAAFMTTCIVMIVAMDQVRDFIILWPIAMLLLCIFAILAPVKGFWDTTVKDDDITASRLWFIKEHAKISEISHCQQVRGGIHIYIWNSDRKVMSLDSMYANLRLLFKRMEKEGISILPFDGESK